MTIALAGFFAALGTYGLDRSLERSELRYAACFIVGAYGYLLTLIYTLFWSHG